MLKFLIDQRINREEVWSIIHSKSNYRRVHLPSNMFNGKQMLFYGVRDNTLPNNFEMKQISSGYHSTFILVHMYLRL